jgi:hypothetical protein
MTNYSLPEMQKILNGGYSSLQLNTMFPEETQRIGAEIKSVLGKNDPALANEFINKVKRVTEQWKVRAAKSGNNPKVVKMAFPHLLRGRLIFLALEEQLGVAVKKGNQMRGDKLNIYNKVIVNNLVKMNKIGTKPHKISRMNFYWRFVTQKRTALAGLGKSGRYCIYTSEFISLLADNLRGKKVLEIGAGNGLLAKLLADKGVDIIATDDFSWSDKISFGPNVEKLAASQALSKYSPEVVLCSWSPPGNDFEAQVFKTSSVRTYIAIGCTHDFASGNRKTYSAADRHFTCNTANGLAGRLFPAEINSEVLVFERRPRTP